MQWNVKLLTSNDVSGKTFAFQNLNNTNDTGTITFNANGTGTITDAGRSGDFTWTIGEDIMTSASHGGGQIYNTLIQTFPGVTNVVYAADVGNGSLILGLYALDLMNAVDNVNALLVTPQ